MTYRLITLWFITLLGLCLAGPVVAQRTDTLRYKPLLGANDLWLEIRYPAGMDTTTRPVPTALFFFGGGWNGGQRSHFSPQANHLVSRGMIVVLADYRTRKSHGTTPFAALTDAKSAVRWVRTHGPALGVDTSRLAVGGGSAGGHLAAAAALVPGYNDATDDRSVSSAGNALLLFNPVVDNGPGGYGYERVGEDYPQFSPLHNLRQGAPPTLFLLGTEDRLIPVATARYYQTVMDRVGSRCDLRLYPGGKHGFFNPANPEFFKQTLMAADTFLVSLGYLPPLLH